MDPQQPQQPYASQPPPYLSASASAEARQAVVNRGKRDVTFGVVWLVVGLGITLFSMAYFQGVGFVVAWGPALYGIYKIIKGAVTVSRH
jgi:hypothetical protein